MAYPKYKESQDLRVKIPKHEHERIISKFQSGEKIRAIAREYGVDKRLIQFILFPERLAAAKKGRDWTKYYDREKHRLQMQKHRARKKQLQGKKISAWRRDLRKKYKDKSRKVV